MQNDLFSNLFINRSTDVQVDTKPNKSSLIELDATVLKHVSGGLVTEAPNGSW